MIHLNRSALPDLLNGEHLKAPEDRTFEEVTIH